jgi:hypothetical protein
MDRRFVQPGKLGVATRPIDDIFRRIDMDDFRAANGRRQRAPAGVGKEVEDFDWGFGKRGAGRGK